MNSDFPFPDVKPLVTRCCVLAAGCMLAWEGEGTELPLGFAVLRLETNALTCRAEERLQRAEDKTKSSGDPVQLLCRALRLAPRCYHRLELAPRFPDTPLVIRNDLLLLCAGTNPLPRRDRDREATFANIAELAAAMRHFGAAEAIDVCLTPDEQTIVVLRDGD